VAVPEYTALNSVDPHSDGVTDADHAATAPVPGVAVPTDTHAPPAVRWYTVTVPPEIVPLAAVTVPCTGRATPTSTVPVNPLVIAVEVTSESG
jgi:hypothetical protein